MIRFSAFLVVVAVGTLVGGVVTSKLLLVYIAIGVSGLALLALGVGAAVNWRELTGKPEAAGAQASTAHVDAVPASTPGHQVPTSAPQSTSAPQTVPSRVMPPEPAQAPAASAVTGTTTPSRAPWSASVPAASSRAGYLPTEPRPSTRPAVPSPWERRDAPASSPPPAREPAAPPAPDDDVSIQDQTLIFRAQDPAPAGREDDATSASEPEPAASASEPPPASAAEPKPAAPEPEAEPESDVTLITAAAPATAPAPKPGTAPADDAAVADATSADDATFTGDATTLTEPAAPDLDLDLEVTVVPGVPRYHKSQCILIRFMGDSDLDKMTVAAAREAGCTPCRACLPDQSDSPAE